MPIEFYLGVASPDDHPTTRTLISHTILRAAARSGETTVFCGACSECLAEGVSVAGLGAVFGSSDPALVVDCPRCGTHNVMSTIAEPVPVAA